MEVHTYVVVSKTLPVQEVNWIVKQKMMNEVTWLKALHKKYTCKSQERFCRSLLRRFVEQKRSGVNVYSDKYGCVNVLADPRIPLVNE